MLQIYTNKMYRQSNESKISLKCPPKVLHFCPPNPPILSSQSSHFVLPIFFGRTKWEDWEDSGNPNCPESKISPEPKISPESKIS